MTETQQPLHPHVTADIEREHVLPNRNWYDIVNTTRRVLIRRGLEDDGIEFEAEAMVALGKCLVDGKESPTTSFKAALDTARRYVTVKLPAGWES